MKINSKAGFAPCLAVLVYPGFKIPHVLMSMRHRGDLAELL